MLEEGGEGRGGGGGGVVFFQAEDGIRYSPVTGVQTCALPIYCQGEEDFNAQSQYAYCRVNMTVHNLTVAAVYQEGGAGNPTLLFNPVMVSDAVLSDEQKLILMDNDHGYLGLAVDRNQLDRKSVV